MSPFLKADGKDGSRAIFPRNRSSLNEELQIFLSLKGEAGMISRKVTLCALFLVSFAFMLSNVYSGEEDDDIRRISKEEAQKLIGKPDVAIIEKNWKKSDMKISGAVREHPNELGSWVGKYPKDHTLILYCD
jgi:hypothetical protein